jgi:hypothetical protein
VPGGWNEGHPRQYRDLLGSGVRPPLGS